MEKHDQFCTQLSTVSPLTVVGDDEEAEKTMEEVSCAPSSDGALRPQKRKKHLKWKKPAGKPHHPRTGYNLFFRFERERILNQMDHMPIASNSVQSIQVHANPRIKEVANILRRRSDSTPGKVGFAGLTRNVAAKWKLLDPKIKEIFERKAAEDKERYKRELEVWQRMEKEKEENASSELESSESQSVNLPVFLMASTQCPSVHRPVFQLASSESQSVADHAIFNFEDVEPRSLSDSSPGLSNQARNAVHECRNNLEHNLFFSTEAQEQASHQHCEIVNQSEHVFPGFSHDDLVGPFFGEQSVVTPSYSRSSESSFPSSSVENRPGRSDGVLSSSIGYFTGEVHNLSSQLQYNNVKNWNGK
jgi:HMG (high mobility group) box